MAAAVEGLGAPEGAPTSLDLKGPTVGEQGPPKRALTCAKVPYVVVADQDPDLRFPADCGSYRCEVCGPRLSREVVAGISWAAARAGRARLVTLTNAPADFDRLRGQLRDFARRLRKDGVAWHWAWSVEVGSETGMVHVHGVQHGPDYVPQAHLQDRWGGRIVDVRAIRSRGGAAYAFKEAARVAGYTTKGSLSDLPTHLDRNGGRVAHWSRGFFHGLTKREAVQEAARQRENAREGLTWHLEPAWLVSGQGSAFRAWESPNLREPQPQP